MQATANPVYCSDNTITRNTAGLSLVTGGTAQTAQDNAVANNTDCAAFTSVVSKLKNNTPHGPRKESDYDNCISSRAGLESAHRKLPAGGAVRRLDQFRS